MKNYYVKLLAMLFIAGSVALFGCKKDDEDPPVDPPSTTVTDVDGNVYNIIEIGGQKWMKENLKTSKYRDGSSISNVMDNTTWINQMSGAWCYYENTASNNDPYGKLYNFYAVADPRGIAPTGWRVATEADWNTLISSLGGATVAGGKLKETGTTHWTSPNTGATNSNNFTALPGGNRFTNGAFYQLGSEAFFWTSTVYSADKAKCKYLTFMSGEIFTYDNAKKQGYSVRCVKE